MNDEIQKARIEEGRVERIRRILAQYEIDAETALWAVHGKAVIYHVALERIATKAAIVFDPPQILRAERDEAVMVVTGRMGAKVEWATGEALVDRNYKVKGAQAPYVYAMAEKRGKDRVILKLIELHGDVYSEEEASDLKQQFDADAASRSLIQEIDACKDHHEIATLMKTKRVTDDLAKMPQEMQAHIKGYAKDAYRYLRTRSQVHRGNGRTETRTETRTESKPHDEWATSRQIKEEAQQRQERTQQAPQTQQRLPENAHDRRGEGPPKGTQGGGFASANAGQKPPDEVLAELKEQLLYCHTPEEVNATVDDFREAIGKLTPPDIEEANRLRKSRIAAIEATERART